MSIASRSEPTRQGAGKGRFVLVVEDEPVLRASMVRGLSKLSDVEVRGAGSVREARTVMAERAPELVISDLDLPDGSGLEVAAELDRRGLRVPLVFASAYVLEYRGRLPQRADVDVLEKPVSLDQLRRLVAERLDRGGEEGASPFSVADYVQLAGMGRRSVAIEVRGRASGRGRIVIRSGEIWAASDELGSGMDAFRRLAFLRDALVTCTAIGPHEDTPRALRGSCEEVLLEAARTLDEQSEASDAVDGEWEIEAEAAGAAPAAPPPRPTFEQHYERGVDALLAKDFPAALEAFSAASELRDDPRVRANLNRLEQMGYAR